MKTENHPSFVYSIINAMRVEIDKHQLQLMQLYPNDLEVHDRALLEKAAFGGAKFGWCVGHCHTHLMVLGLHNEENQHPQYLLNLANDDRFFVIDITSSSRDVSAFDLRFQLKEVKRAEFAALSHTPVRYRRDAGNSLESFSLYKNNERVGYVQIKRTKGGQPNNIYFDVKLYPVTSSPLDSYALELWANYACRKLCHTLLFNWTLTIECSAFEVLHQAA